MLCKQPLSVNIKMARSTWSLSHTYRPKTCFGMTYELWLSVTPNAHYDWSSFTKQICRVTARGICCVQTCYFLSSLLFKSSLLSQGLKWLLKYWDDVQLQCTCLSPGQIKKSLSYHLKLFVFVSQFLYAFLPSLASSWSPRDNTGDVHAHVFGAGTKPIKSRQSRSSSVKSRGWNWIWSDSS